MHLKSLERLRESIDYLLTDLKLSSSSLSEDNVARKMEQDRQQQ